MVKTNDIDVCALPAGTEVVVETCHSRYRLVTMKAGTSNALLQGGRYFGRVSPVRIEGSTAGGSAVRVGWIGVGLCLEIAAAGKRLLTSRVRSIVVDDEVPGSADDRGSSPART